MRMTTMITPFIWLESGASEARDFYLSIFPDAKTNYEMPGPGDEPMGIAVDIGDNTLILFNGGPMYPQTPAFSLMVSVEDQVETDRLWDALTADGGEESRCGWLVDKFGVSWQIIPTILPQVMGGPDPEGRKRTNEAMLKMNKLIIADLEAAYAGTS
jgi:predicted 3-demethylubiquinone-9 3-methyltransferase (glyoxalase superfamily)